MKIKIKLVDNGVLEYAESHWRIQLYYPRIKYFKNYFFMEARTCFRYQKKINYIGCGFIIFGFGIGVSYES